MCTSPLLYHMWSTSCSRFGARARSTQMRAELAPENFLGKCADFIQQHPYWPAVARDHHLIANAKLPLKLVRHVLPVIPAIVRAHDMLRDKVIIWQGRLCDALAHAPDTLLQIGVDKEEIRLLQKGWIEQAERRTIIVARKFDHRDIRLPDS